MLKKIVKIVSTISIVVNLVLGVVLFSPLTEKLYQPLLINEPLKKSEAIVVFSGDGYACGTLGMLTLTRMHKAIQIYRAGWAPKIFCIGGKRFPKIGRSISEVMRDYLILYGIPKEDILISDRARGTREDINLMLDEFGKKYDFHNAMFVTSSFHTFRVKKLLQKKNIEAPVVSTDRYELYPNFWATRLDIFKFVVREYLAICYSKVKGWI